MGQISKTLFCVLIFSTVTKPATIGDGRISLLTGKPINAGDTRGTCYLEGTPYPSETSIPRAHPCHYCLCFNGRIDCYWKRCGPSPQGCTVLFYPEVCNPSLFVCPVPEKARAAPRYDANIGIPTSSGPSQFGDGNFVVPFGRDFAEDERQYGFGKRIRRLNRPENLSQRKRRNVPSLLLPIEEPSPIIFNQKTVQHVVEMLNIRHKRAINSTSANSPLLEFMQQEKGCEILGVKYELGEVVGVATDNCLECRCAAQSLFCSPKCCFEPAGTQLPSLATQRAGSEDESNRPIPPHPLYYIRSEYE